MASGTFLPPGLRQPPGRASDDEFFTLGSDEDVVLVLSTSAISADAEVTGLIEGTSDHQGVAANSLIVSNITNDGDMMFLVSDGGNSLEFLNANADSADLQIGHGMATATLKTASGALTITSAAAATWSTGAGVLTIDGDDGIVLNTTGSGDLQINENVLVGADDAGFDVTFFGATASSYMKWDETYDRLIVIGQVGIGETAPASGSKLHIKDADTGITTFGDGLTLIVEDTGTGGITIACPGQGEIDFADTGSGAAGRIVYNHTTNAITFDTNGTVEKMRITSGGSVHIGDSANGNMTVGLTINQGANDDQILAFKSSDPSGGHGLTTGTIAKDVEIDDYMTFQKQNVDKGGVQINVVSKSDLPDPFFLEVYGGPPAVDDLVNSSAAMQFYVTQHDGANAVVDMATNSNGFTWGEITSAGGGTRAVRMLLKADDGELHLAETTLQGFDNEDDRQIIRAIQKEGSSSGIIESKWDNPFYDYDKLLELGLAGEKNEEGLFLFPVQSRLHAHEGAMWQNYTEIRGMQEKIDTLENRLLAIEGAK